MREALPTIEHHLRQLRAAHSAETVFGALKGKTEDSLLEALKDERNRLAMLLHEDKHPLADKLAAKEAFQRMQEWYPIAQQRIKDGVYGDPGSIQPITLRTKSSVYILKRMVAQGDLATIYGGQEEFTATGKAMSVSSTGPKIIAKVARNPANNALLLNEATQLTALWAKSDPKKIGPPRLIETFEAGSGRVRQRVNILTEVVGDVHTLNEVHAAYPELDLRHVAWMWNRVLANLHVVHKAGIVHGALTPDNFLIVPATHYGTLIDFCHAVPVGSPLKTITERWRSFYPPEVFAKKGATPALDVYMAATCMLYLLGGDPVTGSMVRNVSPTFMGLIRACRIGNPAKRMPTAEDVHHEFSDVLKVLFGPKQFVPFEMPKK